MTDSIIEAVAKCVPVRAVKFTGKNKSLVQDFIGDCVVKSVRGGISISTKSQSMWASNGDYIVNRDGHFEVCTKWQWSIRYTQLPKVIVENISDRVDVVGGVN